MGPLCARSTIPRASAFPEARRRAGRDPRLRQAPPAGEFGRVVENERRAAIWRPARGSACAARRLTKQARRRFSLDKLFEQMQAGGVQTEHRHQGDCRAPSSDRLRAREDPAPGGSRQRHPHRCRRHHRESTSTSRRVDRHGRRLQRAAVVRVRALASAPASRSASTASSNQLTEEDRAALVGMLTPVETERSSRGRGARALQGLAARHDRGLHGHERARRRNANVRISARERAFHETTVARSSASRTTSAG